MNNYSFAISPDSRALADRLAAVPLGGTVSYVDLSAVIGRDVRHVRHLLISARKIAQREAGAVFDSVKDVGLHRLAVEDTPTVGHGARRKIRGTARRASKSMIAVMAKTNAVPNKVRLEANTELSILGLVEYMAKDKVAVNMKAKNTNQQPLPVAVTAQHLLDELQGK